MSVVLLWPNGNDMEYLKPNILTHMLCSCGKLLVSHVSYHLNLPGDKGVNLLMTFRLNHRLTLRDDTVKGSSTGRNIELSRLVIRVDAMQTQSDPLESFKNRDAHAFKEAEHSINQEAHIRTCVQQVNVEV
ncbi:hypothetical protein M405DRAFT_79452 [Rhizopogon salebrosus TDB-379]|nr:hypothetical protein M405DRAFT_79452 [Rhizopogon salebrosus TDB-379]